jgi:hypothetical protein
MSTAAKRESKIPAKTPEQHRRIFYLAGLLKWDIDRLRVAVEEWNLPRLSKMNCREAQRAIECLQIACVGVEIHTPGRMTQKQRWKIEHVRDALKWKDAQVNGMSERLFHVSSWTWLDGGNARKLIETLRGMYRRQYGKYPE